MLDSIPNAVGIAGPILVLLGLIIINLSNVLVKGDNERRIKSGKPSMTDEQIAQKTKAIRIMGSVLILIFLIGFVVALIDLHFFA